jgi:uncharacterized protein (DUF2141 family)
MATPSFSVRAVLVALLFPAVAAAQNSTTLTATAPGAKNTVEFDLNKNPTGIVSVTINGQPADVDTQSINGTKVKVKFAQAPAQNDVIKVTVQYAGTTPTMQGVEWTNS